MDLTLAERLRIIETALDAARALILAVADELDRVKP